MYSSRRIARLIAIAAGALAGLSAWACTDQRIPTDPTPRLAPTNALLNVMSTSAGEVWLCPEGPAGTYSYSIQVTIPANWTNGSLSGTYSASDLATAADAAHQTPVVSPQTFTIPASNSAASCQLVFKVLQSLNYVNQNGGLQDPIRVVTLTQLSAPAGTQLDSIVSTVANAPDVITLPPAVSVIVDDNAFHGDVAAFWNSVHTPPPPPGGQGCTPGYWKQRQHFDSWTKTGYTTGQLIGSVFTVPAGYVLNGQSEGSYTLLQGLSFQGGDDASGKAQILFRAAIAALLNSGALNYPMSGPDIVKAVNAALASGDLTTITDLASKLDGFNNGRCTLN
jgi:hypothetical protein